MSIQQISKLRAEIEENGFAGPFQACTPAEMDELRPKIEAETIGVPSRIYGFPVGRDRHLECRAIHDLFTRPTVTSVLSEMLGPDLLIWRSNFFEKPAGAPETIWHRALLFTEFTQFPILEPPNPKDLFQLTVWFAIDEANHENGCVHLIPGSNRMEIPFNKVAYEEEQSRTDGEWGAKKEGFFGYKLEFDLSAIDMSTAVSMPCKPGEFFVFDQRTLHGSPPNLSDKRRLGINFRAITPDVKAYGHFLPDGHIEHYGHVFDLDKWGCIRLCGEDRFGINKIVEPPAPYA